MEPFTVVLVLTGVLGAVAVTALSLLGARKMISGVLSPLLAQQNETRRILTCGVPCVARVLHVDQTGTTVAVMGEQSYELRFQLEVTPPAGAYRGAATSYRAEMVSLVPMLALSRVVPGCLITVRVDPADPRKMAFETAGTYPPAPGYAPVHSPPGTHTAWGTR